MPFSEDFVNYFITKIKTSNKDNKYYFRRNFFATGCYKGYNAKEIYDYLTLFYDEEEILEYYGEIEFNLSFSEFTDNHEIVEREMKKVIDDDVGSILVYFYENHYMENIYNELEYEDHHIYH